MFLYNLTCFVLSPVALEFKCRECMSENNVIIKFSFNPTYLSVKIHASPTPPEKKSNKKHPLHSIIGNSDLTFCL